MKIRNENGTAIQDKVIKIGGSKKMDSLYCMTLTVCLCCWNISIRAESMFVILYYIILYLLYIYQYITSDLKGKLKNYCWWKSEWASLEDTGKRYLFYLREEHRVAPKVSEGRLSVTWEWESDYLVQNVSVTKDDGQLGFSRVCCISWKKSQEFHFRMLK